ncbi:DUF2971 domain-containing protein [Brevibacillus fluminis]|uniref:DUF2971 domain-containing protein n=1 Tax=Brevibacillus fluminis TaxID=511487 RepID=UPI003F8BBA4E
MQSELNQELLQNVWEEIIHKTKQSKNNRLYHYTNVNGLLGIIKDRGFWVSKADFLNDSEEIIYINRILDGVFDKFQTMVEAQFTEDETSRHLWAMYLKVMREVRDRIDYSGEELEIFVLSMSENLDSLTLWYNYASGDGYCVGLDTLEFISAFSVDNGILHDDLYCVIGEVVYERSEQEEQLLTSFLKLFSFVKAHLYQIAELEKTLFLGIVATIIGHSIFFKDANFANEEEFRLAFISKDLANQVKFRGRRGVVMPYIDFQFKDKLPLRHIVIGPRNNSDIAKKGVTYFLKKSGYDLEQIQVDYSSVPLRY